MHSSIYRYEPIIHGSRSHPGSADKNFLHSGLNHPAMALGAGSSENIRVNRTADRSLLFTLE